MLEEGDVIEIGGNQATVCFKHEEDDKKYICVAFTKPSVKYELYKYKYEDKKLLVAKLTDQEEKNKLMQIFVKKGIDEVGIPEELTKIFDKQE